MVPRELGHCWTWSDVPEAPDGRPKSPRGSPTTGGPRRLRHDGRRRMDAPYRIRPAVLADAPALVAIERRCFGDPWSEASFREALGSAWNFVLVAQASRGVAGYLIGREAGGIGEVLNLAVAPEFRRRGMGEALLEAGLAAFRRSRGDEGFLGGGESDTSARALYAPYRVCPVGQRPGHQPKPQEGALGLRLG